MFESALPVANFMCDGDSQVETRVLCDHTAPLIRASATQLRHTPHLLIPIRQHQVVPVSDAKACS